MTTDPWIADLTLAEIGAVRLRGRTRTGKLRFPLLALAGLQLCSACWVLVAGRDHLAVFYGPALLGVAACSGWHARHTARAHGIQVKVYPWIATATVLMVFSASVSRWGAVHDHPTIEQIGPVTVFALGIVAFGLWARAPAVVSAGVAMTTVSLASALVASGDAGVAVQLVVNAFALALAATSATPRRASS